jgi:hypothetical protein
MTRISDKEALVAVAKANQSLVIWMQQQAATSHERAERATRFMFAHYTLFVQMRQALKETGLSAENAEEATRIAGGPFDFKALTA